MPRKSTAWNGAEALWITVAGWAAAAERQLGKTWIVTSDTIAAHEEVALYPLRKTATSTRPPGTPLIPLVLKTLLKDFILWKSRNRNSYEKNPWDNTELVFVWEQHDLFCGPGWKIASKKKVPFILYVHAPVVWEAKKWGVKRPIWGKFLEYFFERRSLLRADLVACVSDEVKNQIVRIGVPEAKVVVSPMSVDIDRFMNVKDTQNLKRNLKIDDKLVVGWIGSFRPFHGLDSLVRAFSAVHIKKPNTVLLLIGDGSERHVIQKLASDLKISNAVLCPGKISFSDIPYYIQLFDIAVVSADNAGNFHYSPLKLREYLAAKRPTLAPNAGEIPKIFNDREEIILYDVGDKQDLQYKIETLLADRGMRANLGEAGFKKVQHSGTWDFELKKIIDNLNLVSHF